MKVERDPAADSYLDIDLDGVRLIEASAGTGKTFTLATLVTRLVVERGLALGQILAVTFTEAATQELRARSAQAPGIGRRPRPGVAGGPCAGARTKIRKPLLTLRILRRQLERGRRCQPACALAPCGKRDRPRLGLHHPRFLRARAFRIRAADRTGVRSAGDDRQRARTARRTRRRPVARPWRRCGRCRTVAGVVDVARSAGNGPR